MILLPIQLQSLAYMVLMGWGYGVTYSFYNRLFYSLRNRFILYIFEILFHIGYMLLCFYGLFHINYGILNLYLWLAFFLGLYIYLRWYSLLFILIYERIMKLIVFLLRPFIIAKKKFFAIIRKNRERRRRKRSAKREKRNQNKKEKAKA